MYPSVLQDVSRVHIIVTKMFTIYVYIICVCEQRISRDLRVLCTKHIIICILYYVCRLRGGTYTIYIHYTWIAWLLVRVGDDGLVVVHVFLCRGRLLYALFRISKSSRVVGSEDSEGGGTWWTYDGNGSSYLFDRMENSRWAATSLVIFDVIS